MSRFTIYSQCILSAFCVIYLPYLVVVKKVHEDLHDAGEGHQAGAGDEEDIDVVK